jgi:hypothetical protein
MSASHHALIALISIDGLTFTKRRRAAREHQITDDHGTALHQIVARMWSNDWFSSSCFSRSSAPTAIK